MNKAKSNKLIGLILALLLSMACAICMINVSSAKAASVASSYFHINGEIANVSFNEENATVEFKVVNGDKAQIVNTLVVDDFYVEFVIPEKMTSLKLIAITDSYFVTGNANNYGDTTTYDTKINNEVKLDIESGKLYATFNSGAKVEIGDFQAGDTVCVDLDTIDNYLFCKVNDKDVIADLDTTKNSYYKVKTVGVTTADIEFEFEVEGEETASFEIYEIGLKGDDRKYVQDFGLLDSSIDAAKPVVALDSSFFTDSNNTHIAGKLYSVTLKGYSVASNFASTNYTFTETKASSSDEDKLEIFDNSKKISFNLNGANEGNVTFNIVSVTDKSEIIQTYNVKIVSAESEINAPHYLDPNSVEGQQALASYKAKLNESLFKEYTLSDGSKVTKYIRIGSSCYLDLPSFSSLITDETTSYNNLKYTVYYDTPTSSSSTTDLRIPVAQEGNYRFYVVFKDSLGNEMDTAEFVDSEGVALTTGNGAYVFNFHVEDDAPLSITGVAQGNGYTNTSYSATDFKIEASNYTSVYKLYYGGTQNIELDATEGWVEIPVASSITDEEYSENGYTYEDIQAIKYDGKLSFTPNKTGYYKLECTIYSSASARSVTDSVKINVPSAPKVVNNYEWLENNTWSIVFLSVGSLCLVGIVILLFVKPKDDDTKTTKR